MTAKKAKKEKLVVFCIIHKIFYFNNVSIAEEKIMSSLYLNFKVIEK